MKRGPPTNVNTGTRPLLIKEEVKGKSHPESLSLRLKSNAPCWSGAPLCTTRAHLCTTKALLCSTRAPLCTTRAPLCTTKALLCTTRVPRCSVALAESVVSAPRVEGKCVRVNTSVCVVCASLLSFWPELSTFKYAVSLVFFSFIWYPFFLPLPDSLRQRLPPFLHLQSPTRSPLSHIPFQCLAFGRTCWASAEAIMRTVKQRQMNRWERDAGREKRKRGRGMGREKRERGMNMKRWHCCDNWQSTHACMDTPVHSHR